MDIGQKIDYLLVKVSDGEMDICFSDGTLQYTKVIDAETEGEGQFAVQYERLNGIIAAATPTNTVGVNPVEFTVDDEVKSLEAVVSKFISTGDLEGKEVSKMSYKVPVMVPEGMKFGVVTRFDFASILSTVGADEWDGSVLKNAVSVLTANDEKNVTLYFSSQDNKARARNLNFVAVTGAESVVSNGFSIQSSVANILVDVASKFKGGVINVASDIENNICKFVDKEGKEAIQFIMAKRTTVDRSAFDTYEKGEIGDLKVLMHKGALQSALNTIANTNQNDKNTIRIVEAEDGGYALNIKADGALGSISTDINVAIEKYAFAEGIDPTMYEAVILMKTFKHLLAKCTNDWFMMSMNTVDNRYAKVVDTVESEEGTQAKVTYYFPLEVE